MSYKNLFILALITVGIAGPHIVFGQTTNKPSVGAQVPGPGASVAATPGTYIVNGVTPPVNYVREWDGMGRITDQTTFDAASYIDVKQKTQYMDGLGWLLQTVGKQASPGSNPQDFVAPVIYDAVGREAYKYLPYVQTTDNTNDGLFKEDPFNAQKQFYQNVYPAEQPAYNGEQVYYGQVQYEPSPLNRVTKTLAPGNSWAGSNNGVSMQYLYNTNDDNVAIWNIGSDPLTYANGDQTTNIPAFGGYYPAGQLYKTVTTDEQLHTVVEYKDKDGLVILKKVQIGTVANDLSGYTGWLSTYYIYDDLNQLRFVLSPKAVTIAYTNSWNLGADAITVSELCYRYEYDYRKRMTAKKVPGADWVYMIYDMQDRLVYTQDANMRVKSQWMTTLFDAIDRPIATGMVTYNGTAGQLQDAVDAATNINTVSTVTVGGTSAGSAPATLDLSAPGETGVHLATQSITLENGFTTADGGDFEAQIGYGVAGTPFNNNLPAANSALLPGNNFIGLTMTYYDDYSNTTDKQYTTTYNGLLDAGSNQHAETLPSATGYPAIPTTGMVTGSRIRVIENPGDLTQGAWLESASFYDDRGRLIQTQADNYKGGQDINIMLYNFTNKPITTYLVHNNPSATINNSTHIKTNLDLDESNRLVQVYTTINDQDNTKRLIAQHSYDQMGQLKQKQLGQITDGSFLETQDFTYNIRGWLKGINRDYANNDNTRNADDRWFGMDLSYDWGFGTNQFNGNISGNVWRSKEDGQQRAYGYGYDDANRLLFSDFNQYSSNNWDKTAGVDFSSVMGNGIDPSQAYDENGNIQGMKQMAWQVGGSKEIDNLSYNYLTNSNKLKNVIDGDNLPTTTLGDFRTSALSPYSSSKDRTAVDYNYDLNGNLTRDLNKDIGTQATDGIIYNHLNLPWQVKMQSATGTKGTITYIYDATGNKLKKTTMDNSAGLETVTTYIGPFQYQGSSTISSGTMPVDNLQFFGHEEGRVRVKNDNSSGQNVTSYLFDYFLKDHLDNTRTVLTDEQEIDQYPMATMELSNSAQEDLYYTNLDETRDILPQGYPSDPTTNPNAYVAKLHVLSDNQPVIGPGIVLKVMAGDQFSVKFTSWYQLNGAVPQINNVSPVTDIVTAMIAGVSHIPGENPLAAALQSNSATLGPNIGQFITTENSGAATGKPQAFLNWVLLDNQFNYVGSSSGFKQVGDDGELSQPIIQNLPIGSSGYLYIYTSNATPNIDVFFDNLQVTHVRGPMLEENHYYPFGLAMAGISDKAIKDNYVENKYRFNGKELQDQEFSDGSGLKDYDYGARMYDHQIGRWGKIDKRAETYQNITPYAYVANQPTNAVDKDGNLIIFINGFTGIDGTTAGTQWYWREYTDKVKYYANAPRYIREHNLWPTERIQTGRAFDLAVSAQLGDGNRHYVDGQVGYLATERHSNGKEKGYEEAAVLIAGLHRTGGVIDETIKIITHSMGGVFGQGYLEGIQQYLNEHPDLKKQVKITLVADFDPFEASAIYNDGEIKKQQYLHSGKGSVSGLLANEKEGGAGNYQLIESPTEGSHLIMSFYNEISNLKEGDYKWNKGTQQWEWQDPGKTKN